jgi:hypothetical protein
MYNIINIYYTYYILINIEEQTNWFVKLDWTQASLYCRITGRAELAHGRITKIVL